MMLSIIGEIYRCHLTMVRTNNFTLLCATMQYLYTPGVIKDTFTFHTVHYCIMTQ